MTFDPSRVDASMSWHPKHEEFKAEQARKRHIATNPVSPRAWYRVIVTYDNGEKTEQVVGANNEIHAAVIHVADVSKWGPIRYPVDVHVEGTPQPEKFKR